MKIYLTPTEFHNKIHFLEIEKADTLKKRLIGLLSYNQLNIKKAMWFPNTNSIHTFGMKFPIDCLFVDSKWKIIKIYKNLQANQLAWCLSFGVGALEFNAGLSNQHHLNEGMSLYVDN